MQSALPQWTVWEFRSPDGKQLVRCAKRSEPRDGFYQHEYQRIVAVVKAATREEAMRLSHATPSNGGAS